MKGGKWDNCNSIINKYILKKENLRDSWRFIVQWSLLVVEYSVWQKEGMLDMRLKEINVHGCRGIVNTFSAA